MISSGRVQDPSSMTPATSPVEKYLTFSIFAVILCVVPNNITPQGARPATTKGVRGFGFPLISETFLWFSAMHGSTKMEAAICPPLRDEQPS